MEYIFDKSIRCFYSNLASCLCRNCTSLTQDQMRSYRKCVMVTINLIVTLWLSLYTHLGP